MYLRDFLNNFNLFCCSDFPYIYENLRFWVVGNVGYFEVDSKLRQNPKVTILLFIYLFIYFCLRSPHIPLLRKSLFFVLFLSVSFFLLLYSSFLYFFFCSFSVSSLALEVNLLKRSSNKFFKLCWGTHVAIVVIIGHSYWNT